MKSPLRKRLPRELKSEFGKYLVVFIMMAITIAFVSGFLVADGSMIRAYDDSFQKYNIEDGYFRTKKKLTTTQKEDIEKSDVKIYENFYIEQKLTNGSTVRFFKNRKDVDKVCLMKGRMPEKSGEIAVDRMYAENNSLEIGDWVKSGKRAFRITGLVALSDYSALFQNNNDTMFDSVKFGVAIVTDKDFEALNQVKLQYNYAWVYDKKPETEKKEKKMAEDLMEDMTGVVTLESFVPQFQNQSICFTGDDMGSDRAMMVMLLYIVMAILAFVFGITISNTIRKEAGVIGTLRASGYTRRELIIHYMSLPVVITLIGALVGNILGYTLLKQVCAGMYYGSYSLPTYVTIWNAEAFWMTTVVPVIIMLTINSGILYYKLRLSPLKFIRRDLSSRKQKRAVHLSTKLGIFRRFRLRVIFQNISNYMVLFVGILFANLLLFFGLLLPSVLDHYQEEIQGNMLAKYQYILEVPTEAMSGSKLESLLALMQYSNGTETENKTAEKFSAYTLNTIPGQAKSEEVMLYGVEPDSRYIKADLGKGVYVSAAYADKYQVEPGDKITLKEKYERKRYTFKVDGIYNYSGAVSVFMSRDKLNRTFDLGNDYYAGYFSNTKIRDIDEKYIGTVIDLEALTKVSRQLDVSMGNMMGLVNGFAVMIYMIVIYLLSKIIIEKNAQSISMTKILGYTNGEISRLYIMSTMLVVIIELLISLPIEKAVMNVIFRAMMMSSMTGWITLWIDPKIYVEMFLIGFVTYGGVALLEYRKIRKVPMDEALKNVE